MNQGKIVTQIGVLRRIDGPIPYWVWQATAEVASGGSVSHVIIPFADDRVPLDGYIHPSYPPLS